MSILAWILVLTSRPFDLVPSEIKLMIGVFLTALYLKHGMMVYLLGAVGSFIELLYDDGNFLN